MSAFIFSNKISPAATSVLTASSNSAAAVLQPTTTTVPQLDVEKGKTVAADSDANITAVEEYNTGKQSQPTRRRSLSQLFRTFYTPFLTSSHPAPIPSDPVWTRVVYSCTCPPHGLTSRFLTRLLVAIFSWCLIFGIVKHDALPPDGKFFALWLLIFGGFAAGWLAERFCLPALFGMLLWGFALRNVPYVNVAASLDTADGGGRVWASQLRNIALAVILLRAGLGLDVDALKRLKWVIFNLAVIPSCAVVVTMLLLGRFLLLLPYAWSLLLGLVSCAVSPAVIVPLMLILQDERYGTQKGIPSAVIAAATLGGVLAVCGFGLVLGMLFSTGSLTLNILRAPIEIAMGVVYGIIVGAILWFIPAPSGSTKTLPLVTCRFILLVCAGVGAVCCAKALNITGAGILGCLLTGLVAASGWTKQQNKNCSADLETAGIVDRIGPVAISLKFIWLYIFQPLLFGLVGAAVAVQQLKLQTICYALAIILVAHIIQFSTAFGVASWRGFGFTLHERLFLAFTALPKATIQAAIGSVALDTVRERTAVENISRNNLPDLDDRQQLEQFGQDILTIAVLSIILTAPLGALAIMIGGRRLLEKDVLKDANAARAS